MILTIYNNKVWEDKLSWSLEHNDTTNNQITIDTDNMRYTKDGINWVKITK